MHTLIHKAWGTSENEHWFPGPQPVSIERQHFSILKKNEYLVCHKMDGTRHLLVSFEIDGVKKVALMNRAFQTTYLSYTLPKDTILDGELVKRNDGKDVFLVHDAVMIRGEDVKHLSLVERLDKARTLVRSIMSKTPFVTLVKTMIPLSDIGSLKDEPYETDGLIMTPIHEPVRSGTHETMFKWKPRHRITIDFMIRNGNELYIQERGRLMHEAFLYGTRNMIPDGTIVECEYSDNGWSIVKLRDDKTYPNNRRTFLRTLVNLREDIQLKEFIDLFQNGDGSKGN